MSLSTGSKSHHAGSAEFDHDPYSDHVELPGVVLVAAVMAVGLAGVIVPVLPGTMLIWAAGLVFGVIDGFHGSAWLFFGLMTLLMAAGTVGKYALPHRAGVSGGAPRASIVQAVALGVVGFFVLPVVGLPVGVAAGFLLAEHRRLGDWSVAWSATKRVLAGFGLGVLVELSAGIAMILLWIVWVALR